MWSKNLALYKNRRLGCNKGGEAYPTMRHEIAAVALEQLDGHVHIRSHERRGAIVLLGDLELE